MTTGGPIGPRLLGAVASTTFLAALLLMDGLARAGIRVGRWHPSVPPLFLLLTTWLLAAALMRPGRRGIRALAGAGLVALLVAVVVVASALPREQPQEPWDVRVRLVSQPMEDARALALPLDALRTPRRLATAIGRSNDVDLEVLGVVSVPASGRHALQIQCGGTCSLEVAGREVLRGPGTLLADVDLDAGEKPIRATLVQPADQAFLRIDWQRPSLFQAARFSESGRATRPRALGAVERSAWAAAWQRWLLQAGAALLAFSLAHAALAARFELREWLRNRDRVRALAMGLAAILVLAALHAWAAAHALPRGYLHPWTSEYMMQSVSVADLRGEPVRSLVFLHIQPPLFDALRALLVSCHRHADGLALVEAVDRGLYAAWGLVYGGVVALVAAWLTRLCGLRAGLMGAALFAFHPAALFYATFLDSTFLGSALTLWIVYELWRVRPGQPAHTARLSLAVIALFLTRSLVQWPFVVVLAVALWLRRCPRTQALRVLAAVSLVIALYVAKQYSLFGLTITSSFGPDSFCKGLSEYCPGVAEAHLPHPLPAAESASVLRRIAKVDGEYNYNQLAFLQRSFAQMEEYKRLLRALSPQRAAHLMSHNLEIWLRPSSRHSPHVLVDLLPWRTAFDRVFSGAPLVLLLLWAAALWAYRARKERSIARGLGLALPVAYVAATTIVFESGENMRYKFFVEPLLYVFIWSQLAPALLHRWSPAR